MEREPRAVEVQVIVHKLMVALSKVAINMQIIAALVETGDLSNEEISTSLKTISTAMTQMVNEISQ